MNRVILLVLLLGLLLSGCASQTLDELLARDPHALSSLSSRNAEIVCKDYTIYNTGGGIEDATNATRYARGLIENPDRFLNYRYIVKDNSTGWLYIFESLDDIPIWAKNN